MSPSPEPQVQIVIVDEDPATGELLDLILAAEGYVPRVVQTQADAGALCAQEEIALVVTGLFPPHWPDPLQAVDAFRAQVAPCPVSVVTGWPLPPDALVAPGFAFLMAKPFDLDDLLLHVAASLTLPLGPAQERHVTRVHQYFAALTARDWDALLALCDDAVTYVLPAPAPLATTLQGTVAFRRYTEETFRHFPAARFTDVRVYATPRGLAAHYQGTWQTPGGEEMQQQGAVIFTFADERISHIGSLVEADTLRCVLADRSPIIRR